VGRPKLRDQNGEGNQQEQKKGRIRNKGGKCKPQRESKQTKKGGGKREGGGVPTGNVCGRAKKLGVGRGRKTGTKRGRKEKKELG